MNRKYLIEKASNLVESWKMDDAIAEIEDMAKQGATRFMVEPVIRGYAHDLGGNPRDTTRKLWAVYDKHAR